MILTVSLNPAVDADYLVERLRWEDRNPVLEERRAAGGKGLNVSRVVQELGGRTLAITTVGGRTGVELRQLLKTAKTPSRFVTIAGNTRTNLAITERDGRSVRLNPKGPKVSARELRAVFRVVRCTLPKTSFLVLSGSLPPGVSADTYARFIELARRFGVPCALDADGEVFRRGISARPWLVKPNRFEAERLLQRKIRTEKQAAQAAREIMERWNVGVVLLSLGKDGAIVAAQEDALTLSLCRRGDRGEILILRATSPPVRVHSAIGAGDSALAAFLMRWEKKHSLEESLRWAVAAGTACAMTPATELCHRDDVERLVKRVVVKRLHL